MNFIIKKFTGIIRFLCILSIVTLGLAAITGSGDDNGSSSTEYETIETTFDFDQINVDYDGSNPTTEACISTSMLNEAIDAGLVDAENIRVINSNIDILEVKYDALWSNIGSLQTITCLSEVRGDWSGPIDTTVLNLGDSGWTTANAINTSTRTAFTNYLTNYEKTYQLCVSCSSNNLFNSFKLDYWISMGLTLTVAYDNVEETPTE